MREFKIRRQVELSSMHSRRGRKSVIPQHLSLATRHSLVVESEKSRSKPSRDPEGRGSGVEGKALLVITSSTLTFAELSDLFDVLRALRRMHSKEVTPTRRA